MECNKEGSLQAKELAEKRILDKDFEGAQRMLDKARRLYPNLEGLNQVTAAFEVLKSTGVSQNDDQDWYAILQVEVKASAGSIKSQYRKLALQLHPDKNKSSCAEPAFKLVSEAYAVLSDATKRALYDAKRSTKRLNPTFGVNPPKRHTSVKKQGAGAAPTPAANSAYANFSTTYNPFNQYHQKQQQQYQYPHGNPSPASQTAFPPKQRPEQPQPQPGMFYTQCPFCLMDFMCPFTYKFMDVSCLTCSRHFKAIEKASQPPPSNVQQQSGIPTFNAPNANNFQTKPEFRDFFAEPNLKKTSENGKVPWQETLSQSAAAFNSSNSFPPRQETNKPVNANASVPRSNASAYNTAEYVKSVWSEVQKQRMHEEAEKEKERKEKEEERQKELRRREKFVQEMKKKKEAKAAENGDSNKSQGLDKWLHSGKVMNNTEPTTIRNGKVETSANVSSASKKETSQKVKEFEVSQNDGSRSANISQATMPSVQTNVHSGLQSNGNQSQQKNRTDSETVRQQMSKPIENANGKTAPKTERKATDSFSKNKSGSAPTRRRRETIVLDDDDDEEEEEDDEAEIVGYEELSEKQSEPSSDSDNEDEGETLDAEKREENEPEESEIHVDVPDSDFYNFDDDRSEASLKPGEVWSLYDTIDGMPRYYAKIHSVTHQPEFQCSISWLESTRKGIPLPDGSHLEQTWGMFRMKPKPKRERSIHVFSHKVEFTTHGSMYSIQPKIGQCWALVTVKDKGSEEKDKKKAKRRMKGEEYELAYEFVVILSELSTSSGLQVCKLVKNPAFKAIFEKSSMSMVLNPSEIQERLSHRLPSRICTGDEGAGVPFGAYEIDTASAPLHYFFPKQKQHRTF